MLGDTIQLLRTTKNVTVEQLAEAIEVSPLAIEKYEANIWQPGKTTMIRLAKYFGITLQELSEGYSFLVDDDTHDILIVRNMGENRIRAVGKL
jgi:transcriptional regulator with XRE-family HTH domain